MLVALARALLAGRVLAGASWRRGIAHIALALHTFENPLGLEVAHIAFSLCQPRAPGLQVLSFK